jgi:hypothetical protein
MNNSVGNLLKIIGIGAVLYGVYKMGENGVLDSIIQKNVPDENLNEEDSIRKTIQELKQKQNKTRRDRDNIGLLEIKLKQLTTVK